MTKASEILKQCCGNHYNNTGEKDRLVAMVEKLERDNESYKNKGNDADCYCCLGKDHPCPLNVNDGFCAAAICQYKVRAI